MGLMGPARGPQGEKLPPPIQDEIVQLTASTVSCLVRLARRRLGDGAEPDAGKATMLASMCKAIAPLLSPEGIYDAMEAVQGPPRLCAKVHGFCLHAARKVGVQMHLAPPVDSSQAEKP